MSDLRVWTLCEHGSRVRHWWFENEDDEDDETYVSCPGGKEMVLRREDICTRTGDRWPCWSGCEESNRITNYTEVDE